MTELEFYLLYGVAALTLVAFGAWADRWDNRRVWREWMKEMEEQ